MDVIEGGKAAASVDGLLLDSQQAAAAVDVVRCYLSASDEDLPGDQRGVLSLLLDQAQASIEKDN